MRAGIICFFFVVIHCSAGWSQYVAACFKFIPNDNDTVFCVGEIVTVKNCIDATASGSAQYGLFNFGDGRDPEFHDTTAIPAGSDMTHIYTKAGIYRVKQWGGRKKIPVVGEEESDTTVRYVVVVPSHTAQFDVGLCEAFKAVFIVKDSTSKKYSLVPDTGVSPLANIPNTPSYTYTYSDATSKTATMTPECGLSTSLTFTPLDKLVKPDLIDLRLLKSGTQEMVSLSFNALPFLKYRILRQTSTGGSFSPIDTVEKQNGVASLSYPLSSDACYKIENFDDCGNTITSEILCSNTLKVAVLINENSVSWNLPVYGATDVIKYQLFRNNFPVPGAFTSGQTTYIDKDVVCGRAYTYYLKAISNKVVSATGQPLMAFSQQVTDTAQTDKHPNALQDLNASVTANGVLLIWTQPLSFTVSSYKIKRSEDGAAFTDYASSVVNSYTDTKVNTQNGVYCYEISYLDSCNAASDDSLITCPMQLKVHKGADEVSSAVWTRYSNGSGSIFSYKLDRLDEKNNVLATLSPSGSNTFLDDGPLSKDIVVVKYRVSVIVNGMTLFSNIVTLRNDLMLFLPDAFSPNNDYINETYAAKGRYFKDFKMAIFNRWGELIYYSENAGEGWDGNYKGEPANVDTYVYVVTAKDNSGKELTKKGSLILMR